MKVGDVVRVTGGTFKGCVVTIVEVHSGTYKVRLGDDFTASCGCCSEDDDCGEGDSYECGDEVIIKRHDIEDELTATNREIQKSVLTIQGLLLKKKMLENPIKGEKEIKKLLECIKL